MKNVLSSSENADASHATMTMVGRDQSNTNIQISLSELAFVSVGMHGLVDSLS
jgi:hypothetical protein